MAHVNMSNAIKHFPSESRAAGATEAEVLMATCFDVLIFVAYFTIPAQLYWYLKGIPQSKAVLRIRLHFIAFIVCCGLSHLFAALSDAGLVRGPFLLIFGKGITAIVSMKTAHLLSQHAGEVLWLFSRTTQLETFVEELKRANAEADEMRQAAVASAQTSKAILSSVSHELRTPIHAIKGTLEVILPGVRNSEHRVLLGAAQASAAQLLDTISKILNFTSLSRRQPSMNMRPAELAWVGEQVMDLSKLSAPQDNLSRLIICLELSPTAPRLIVTDEALLVCAMRALVENAVKYTDNGHVVLRIFTRKKRQPVGVMNMARDALSVPSQGSSGSRRSKRAAVVASLRMSNSDDPSQPEASPLLPQVRTSSGSSQMGGMHLGRATGEKELVFQVEDTGIGIPHDMKTRIFQQLVRVDGTNSSKYSGIGMGLAICSKIMARVGGEVRCVDNVEWGRGSIFEVTIPLPATPDPRLAGAPPPPPMPRHGGRIFIIATDDIVFQRCMDSLLRHFGVAAIIVCNRTDATLSQKMDGSLAFLGPDVVTDSAWSAIWADWEASAHGTTNSGRRCIAVLPVLQPADGDVCYDYRKFGLSLELPVVPSALEEVLHACSNGTAVSGKGAPRVSQEDGDNGCPSRVLIVDDSSINLQVAKSMTRRASSNAVITTAEDGLVALDRWKEAAQAGTAPFDLVLMDLSMPKLDGRGAAQAIRALPCGGQPLISALTGDYLTDSDVKGLLESGFDKVVMKPLAMKTLKQLLSESVNRQQAP
uniref:Ethylene receptor n=1 Tax=Tetraselmis chuii TaxID=63592 RepID=A0A7S1X1L1_9CHLO|mmetsp:Transcript_21201/g.37766  ORF Transcript_21201/g.37766 Transcript_21201/m.37766 type:complete len:762 (+) Transcript_21201:349-2634(+)